MAASAASASSGSEGESFFVERVHFFELLAQAVACRDAAVLEPLVKRMTEIVSRPRGRGRGRGRGRLRARLALASPAAR